MELFGKTEPSTSELADLLEFTVVHRQGPIEIIVVTQGNMGKLLQTEQQIATKNVLGMSYRHGGEDQMYGLYVKLRSNESCTLPRLSEDKLSKQLTL
jgi:hypothetical protein